MHGSVLRDHGHAGRPPFTRFMQIRGKAGISLSIGLPFMLRDVVLNVVVDMAQGQPRNERLAAACDRHLDVAMQ